MVQLDRAGPARRRSSGAKVAGGAVLLLLAAATSPSAFAQWTGQQPATLSSYALFSISGNTVTVTEPASPVTISVNGGTPGTLLGISGIWIVDSSGNPIGGVSANAGQGSVSGIPGTAQWNPLTNPAGYKDVTNGGGYGGGDAWLQLASNSLVSAGSGKTGTGYTTGTFTFAGLSSLSGYDLGIDYLQANGSNGNTGRAFFTPNTPTPVPEPGAVATMLAMGGTTALGLLRGRRSRRRAL